MAAKNEKRTAPPRQKDFLEEIMTAKLDRIKFTDLVTAEASGPQLVVVPLPQGGQDLQTGWMLTVWLTHNRLIGQGPVGVSVPIGGISPPVEHVNAITERLLDKAREIRQKANEPPATPDANEMLDAIRRHAAQGPNGQGPPT